MKKIIKYLIVILFFMISIYYTEHSMNILNQNDPIIAEIKNNLDKYKVEPINGKINNNIIIPGKKGQEVDIEKTYKEMKKYGIYNEALTKIKEVEPVISIEENKDKYIKLTANDNKTVSLLFIIKNNYDINNLLKILKNNNIKVTIYIEKSYIENNIKVLKETNQSIELLIDSKELFKANKKYLEAVIDNKLNYCYLEEENDEILNLCKKNKMYTVIPSKIIKNNLYKNVKNSIEYSPIISIYPNKYIEKELTSTIKYLKKKGYKFYDLKTILSEDN